MSEPLILAFKAPPLPHYLECGKSVYEPGEQHPNRKGIGMFDLLFVTQGVLHIGEEERTWPLLPGQTLILKPDAYHYSVMPCQEETTFYWLHFQCTSAAEELEGPSTPLLRRSADGSEKTALRSQFEPYTILLPKHMNVHDPDEAVRYWERLIRLKAERRSIAFWEEQRLFLELLMRLEDRDNRSDASRTRQLAAKTEAYLRQHYQSDVSNERLSVELHFHANYITRCMKETYDCTPMEYLQAYRLEQAKLLLLGTDWPVETIAEHVGFRLAAYFSFCFRKKEGMSPLRFRKHYRNH
jgi:AraC-like DNA-binding protein